MKNLINKKSRKFSRRDFIKTSAALAAATVLPAKERLFAAGSDTIRVGLIGCGGQGTRDAISCLSSAPNVELVAMADLFKDRIDESLETLKKEKIIDSVKVTPDTCFVGIDACKKLLASGVDMVLIVTPPHFHPEQLKAAIEAGKHVFVEKPAAVDPAGVRTVIAAADLAQQKGLSIVAGTQRRHDAAYRETMKRIQNGDIGKILGGQVYWNGGDMVGYWKYYEKNNMPDMEWQLRNWPWFAWLSGDHIVEQHVHNLDIMHWAMGTHPTQAMGMGGRQVRKEGNIFDHFAVEYEFENGVRFLGMCRQIEDCHNRVEERFVGDKGVAYGHGIIEGQNPYSYEGQSTKPSIQEHTDLIESIRNAKPINEGKQVAESTMTAIMGRMSAYTGRALSWDWAMNASKLDYTPPSYDFNTPFPPQPPAVPGKTELI